MGVRELGHRLLRAIRSILKTSRIIIWLALLSVPLVGSRLPNTLEQILNSGTLTVISRNGPTTYYEDANGYTGFEYLLAKRFAKSLGVELEIKEVEHLGSMLDAVGGLGDFAAAGLSITPKREKNVHFSRP